MLPSGSGFSFITAGAGGQVQIGWSNGITNVQTKIVFQPGTNLARTVMCDSGGYVSIVPSVLTFEGNPVGKRYIAATNGVISTNGAGKFYIPGTSDGAVFTGGQYV